jgi:hypothetical protein
LKPSFFDGSHITKSNFGLAKRIRSSGCRSFPETNQNEITFYSEIVLVLTRFITNALYRPMFFIRILHSAGISSSSSSSSTLNTEAIFMDGLGLAAGANAGVTALTWKQRMYS